jgi:nitrite reductase/ring-hydroxylating ferredoxin subunit
MSNAMPQTGALLHTMPLELLQRRICVTFSAARGQRLVHGMAVWTGGSAQAWLNRCPHWGIQLDGSSSEIVVDTGDSVVLRCSAHGAEFAVDTGVCLSGPCEGDRLSPLHVEVDANIVRVYAPPALVIANGAAPIVRTRR